MERRPTIRLPTGGLAVYVKTEIALYTTIIREVSDITHSLEQLWLRVKVPGRKHFVISVMYRPPAGSIKTFMNELKNGLNVVFDCNRGEEHNVMGDFNIDFGHMENTKCKNLWELMDEFSLRHHATGYTRVTKVFVSPLLT